QIWAEIAVAWCVFAVIWLAIARRLRVNLISPSRNLTLSLLRTIEAWAATWGIAGMLALTITPPLDTMRIWLVLFAGAALLSFTRVAASFSSTGIPAKRLRAVVIGACPSARALSS